MLIKKKMEGKIHCLSFITVLEDWVAFPLVISNSSEEQNLTPNARTAFQMPIISFSPDMHPAKSRATGQYLLSIK